MVVQNFSRHPLSVDQVQAIRGFFDPETEISDPLNTFFKGAEDFATQVSAKVSSIVVPADILLEAQANGLLSIDTVLIFWRADEDSRKRGRFAARAMKVFSLDIGNKWNVDIVVIQPTVESDIQTNQTFAYGS